MLVGTVKSLADLLTWPRHEPLLICDECRFFTGHAVGMNKHTTVHHSRSATRSERTPLTPEQRADVIAAAKNL